MDDNDIGDEPALGFAKALATSSWVTGLERESHEVHLKTPAMVEEETGLYVNREPQ